MEIDEFRRSLDDWLDQHEHVLAADHAGTDTLDDQMAQLAKVKRLTYEAGFMRWGWPERVGGLGGSTLLRAYLGNASKGGVIAFTKDLACKWAPHNIQVNAIAPG